MQADQINWLTPIGNMGLWTRLGIPTKATRLRTHHLVRFFVGLSCSFDFWIGWRTCAGLAGCFYFIRGVQFQPNPAPRAQNTQNCDAKCDCL